MPQLLTLPKKLAPGNAYIPGQWRLKSDAELREQVGPDWMMTTNGGSYIAELCDTLIPNTTIVYKDLTTPESKGIKITVSICSFNLDEPPETYYIPPSFFVFVPELKIDTRPVWRGEVEEA